MSNWISSIQYGSRHEIPDLPFPVNDQPNRGGLHPPDAVFAAQAPACQGGEDVAHQSISDPSTEESAVQPLVGLFERHRLGEGFLQSLFGDFVDLQPSTFLGHILHLFVDMAADCIPLAVRVAGQHDDFVLGRCAQIFGEVLLFFVIDEGRLVGLQVDTHAGIGQVFEMTHR